MAGLNAPDQLPELEADYNQWAGGELKVKRSRLSPRFMYMFCSEQS
jgi:hypothetical protein